MCKFAKIYCQPGSGNRIKWLKRARTAISGPTIKKRNERERTNGENREKKENKTTEKMEGSKRKRENKEVEEKITEKTVKYIGETSRSGYERTLG